jgi:putative restriction endonuclease
MGIETDRVVNVGGFSQGQRRYLDYHRSSVLLQAAQ